jgi:hypothetical protein
MTETDKIETSKLSKMSEKKILSAIDKRVKQASKIYIRNSASPNPKSKRK